MREGGGGIGPDERTPGREEGTALVAGRRWLEQAAVPRAEELFLAIDAPRTRLNPVAYRDVGGIEELESVAIVDRRSSSEGADDVEHRGADLLALGPVVDEHVVQPGRERDDGGPRSDGHGGAPPASQRGPPRERGHDDGKCSDGSTGAHADGDREHAEPEQASAEPLRLQQRETGDQPRDELCLGADDGARREDGRDEQYRHGDPRTREVADETARDRIRAGHDQQALEEQHAGGAADDVFDQLPHLRHHRRVPVGELAVPRIDELISSVVHQVAGDRVPARVAVDVVRAVAEREEVLPAVVAIVEVLTGRRARIDPRDVRAENRSADDRGDPILA